MKFELHRIFGGFAGTFVVMALVLPVASCVRVKVEPVRIDATVTIRVERELDDFFSAIDSSSKTIGANPAPERSESKGGL